MYEGQLTLPALSLDRIQAVARVLVSDDYQVKEAILTKETAPPRDLSFQGPVGKIRLLPTQENLGEICIFFSADEQSILVVASTDSGYKFAGDLCDELKKEPNQALSCMISKISLQT